DLEVIIVDDGSPIPLDPELDRSRVRILRHERNLGAAAARNSGVAMARAGWIAFLDSDDVWIAGSLAPRLARAREEKDPASTIWGAGFVYVGPEGRRYERWPIPSENPIHMVSGV